MKKQIAAMIGVAFLLTVVAGSLYRGHNFMIGSDNADDPRAGKEAHPVPFWSLNYIPPDPDFAALQRNMEAKDAVAEEVIAGRMTLAEAADRFRVINAARPSHLPFHLDAFPGGGDEERNCRHVIRFVDSSLMGRPDREAVVARLESELQRHLAGKVEASSPPVPVQRPTKVAD
jgi:hypothetical protein